MNKEFEEKNKIIEPNLYGYKDRKMAKWQGLILSEHTESLHEQYKKNTKNTPVKDKQNEQEIFELIDYSFSQKKPICVQMDYLSNGNYDDYISGVVVGYNHNDIYIQTDQKKLIVCDLELIRNIETTNKNKWFEV